MTEEEIEKEAKEYSQGNFYSEQGFLYGYERGYEDCRHYAHDYYKPKWHEIDTHVKPSREIEKKYMPKSRRKVMLKYHFYGDDEIHYSDGYYDCFNFEFHTPNNPTGKIICVIAWCELSKFEE